MDNFFAKLGLYDFFAVIFPGFISSTLLEIIYRLVLEGNIYISINTAFENTLIYIVLSYFIGIILHEVGYRVQGRTIYKKGDPTKTFLFQNSVFNNVEIQVFYSFIEKKFGKPYAIPNKENCTFIFHYCKRYLTSRNLMASAEKKESIYGMSRSLFSFFLIMSITLPITFLLFNIGKQKCFLELFIICEIVIIFSMYLFFIRAQRFAKAGVADILRTFLAEYDKDLNPFF